MNEFSTCRTEERTSITESSTSPSSDLIRPFDSLHDLGRAAVDLKRIERAIRMAGTPLLGHVRQKRRRHFLT